MLIVHFIKWQLFRNKTVSENIEQQLHFPRLFSYALNKESVTLQKQFFNLSPHYNISHHYIRKLI